MSNSSSLSYIVTNKTDKDRTLVDFVSENPDLLEIWNSVEESPTITREELLESARMFDFVIVPGNNKCDFRYSDAESLVEEMLASQVTGLSKL